MRRLAHINTLMTCAALVCGVMAHAGPNSDYRPPVKEFEEYKPEPLPPGFSVQLTDVDGPVFADPRGLTLYTWPLETLRNGEAGEHPDQPTCDNTRYTENTGYMTPYPKGLVLPDLPIRATCADVWRPVTADAGAKPVGKFSVVTRKDGTKQWAYERYALYTSSLDTKAGQVNGGTRRERRYDAPVLRRPIGPASNVPPAFDVKPHATGRLIVTGDSHSVYTWDGDEPNKSNCRAQCSDEWTAVIAGELVVAKGDWGIIERSPGVKQWTFRGKPLYTRVLDRRLRSLEGSDVQGWHNVYTQKNPEPPAGFTVQSARIGQVLADSAGRTLYVYNCGEDTVDQLACDHPTTTQAYRLAVCGNFDAERCNKTWPYVPAPENAVSGNLIWGTAWIDPKSGKLAEAKAAGAVHVWTFRDRPVYTFAQDTKPGDAYGDAWGEFWGNRNGFKAFWLRDDFTSAGRAGGNAD
ncbi:COG4315 family predicted lipoprotein [Peristeroidobacter soli]|uniref:hypothetical protein n=1 Tax=Peristeroidobacter soli TaxID=2497877 RepID=UPI00101D9272|nr:hypothetical protein [Peristeroidobacter soli]